MFAIFITLALNLVSANHDDRGGYMNSTDALLKFQQLYS